VAVSVTESSDLCLDRMARWLTAKFMTNPATEGWLVHQEDEVYSEALVAVCRANEAYPGQVCRETWTPGVARYAGGCLARGLMREKILPNGGPFVSMRTNWEFGDVEA